MGIFIVDSSRRELPFALEEFCMKKTLMICDEYSLPENNGGSIRTMNFVRFFKQLGTVDLMYKRPTSHTGAADVFRKEYFSPNRYDGDRRSEALRIRLHRVIYQSPWLIGDISFDSRNQFLSILNFEAYDIILVRYLSNTSYIFDLPKEYRRRVIIDYDDIRSDSLFKSYCGEAHSLYSKFRFRLEKKFLRNYERKCLGLGAALFCSEEDRKKIVCLNKTT